MTIPVQVPRNSYIGDGANDRYAFTFTLIEQNDIEVTVNGVAKVLSVDYNLENVTTIGGDVVFIPGQIPILNAAIVILRTTDLDQLVSYTPFDPFPAKTHEGALDKLTLLLQELRRDVVGGEGPGLPLDPTGTFWNSGSLSIKNILTPADGTDAANKAYVDSLVSVGFDPTADQLITGIWTFTQVIEGICSGNLVLTDLAPYTQRLVNEAIMGAWTVADGGGSQRKIAARNPRERLLIVDDTPTQADEGVILRVTDVAVSNITLEQLEQQTTFSIFTKAVGVNLLQGTGVTINVYDGGDVAPPTGNRFISQASVVQVQYESATEITIYGNGIN